MQEALRLLSELSPEDIAWLATQGSEQQFAAGALIIREGDNPAAILIVLAGLVGVGITSVGDQQLGQRRAPIERSFV